MASEIVTQPLVGVLETIIDHRGKTPKKLGGDFCDTGVRVLSAKNIKDGHIDFSTEVRYVSEEMYDRWMPIKLEVGDVLLTSEAPLGETAFLRDDADFCLGQRLFALRPNPELVHSRYLYYALRSHRMQHRLNARATGTTAQGIRQSELLQVLLDFPQDIKEQRAIAAILGALDDKIELNRRMNATLEAIARTLFKSWFVDFDPVRAKAAGEQPPGLAPHIADLFPDEFVDSELGAIPKGWKVGTLGDLMRLDKGLSYKGAFLTPEGIPMINLGCFLGQGRFSDESIKYYSGDYRRQHVIHIGDLLIANTDITQKREVLGSPALVPPNQGAKQLLFTHHVFAARFGPDKTAWKLFAFFLLLQDEFRGRASGFATGTTVLALPRDAVLGLKFVVPPIESVLKFKSIVERLIEKQWHNTRCSRTLAALRDTLLPKLISGELRVRDAARVIVRYV